MTALGVSLCATVWTLVLLVGSIHVRSRRDDGERNEVEAYARYVQRFARNHLSVGVHRRNHPN